MIISRWNIKLTDEEIENLFSEIGYGVDVDELSFRSDYDVIGDFKEGRDKWTDKGRPVIEGKIGNLRYVEFQRVQSRVNQQRTDIVIIELPTGESIIYGLFK